MGKRGRLFMEHFSNRVEEYIRYYNLISGRCYKGQVMLLIKLVREYMNT